MTSYERVKVVRQGEQRQTHPVGHEPMARQPSPVQRLLPLLDPLLGCPSTIVETRTTPSGPAVMFVTMKPTRGNKPRWRDVSLPIAIPRHLGHHPPSAVTTPGTIPKVVVLGSLDSPAASPQEITRRCAVCVIARPTHLAFTRPNPSTLPSWDKHLGLEPAHGVGADGRLFQDHLAVQRSPASSDRRPTVQRRWYLGSPPDDCTPTA